MDFTTLQQNLELQTYQTFGEFISDAYLIFENCRHYNGASDNNYFLNTANQCETSFIKEIGDIFHSFNQDNY